MNQSVQKRLATIRLKGKGVRLWQYDPTVPGCVREVQIRETQRGRKYADIDPTRELVAAINLKNARRKLGLA